MIDLLNIFPIIPPHVIKPKSKVKQTSWEVDENDFPHEGSYSEQLKFLLNYAILAPSSHNTQPWIFQIVDNAIELYADKTRGLAIADPNHRELTISCGAALFNLRIAIRHFGYRDLVEILPASYQPNLLARIHLGSKRIAQQDENFLFRAITHRATNRKTFDDCPLASSLVAELQSAANSTGNWLQIKTLVIPESCRQTVINLIAQGDRLQMANPLFRRELAQWIHGANNPKQDGIPLSAQGLAKRWDALAPLVSLAIRILDLGKLQSAQDCQLAIKSPVLMLLGSSEDNPQDWLATGEALAHLLLRARVDQVWASFLNQPIQVPQLRSRLKLMFPEYGHPQLLLRLGYAPEARSTPRRTVDRVLTNDQGNYKEN